MKANLLLIDEPSKGLAPVVIEKVMEAMMEMKKTNDDYSCGTKFYYGK